jgi:hypothetical protein
MDSKNIQHPTLKLALILFGSAAESIVRLNNSGWLSMVAFVVRDICGGCLLYLIQPGQLPFFLKKERIVSFRTERSDRKGDKQP